MAHLPGPYAQLGTSGDWQSGTDCLAPCLAFMTSSPFPFRGPRHLSRGAPDLGSPALAREPEGPVQARS